MNPVPIKIDNDVQKVETAAALVRQAHDVFLLVQRPTDPLTFIAAQLYLDGRRLRQISEEVKP